MRNILLPSLALQFAMALLVAQSPAMAAVGEPAVSDPDIKPRSSTVPVITDDTGLFETFGGREGLVKIMDDVMPRWVKNPRTRPFFESSDQERIKRQLVEQFCVIMKGPCEYSGRSMAEAHRGMNVNEGAFFGLFAHADAAAFLVDALEAHLAGVDRIDRGHRLVHFSDHVAGVVLLDFE